MFPPRACPPPTSCRRARTDFWGVLGGGAPQPQWLVTLLTPRGYCRDFNIAVESGLVSGPQRSLDFFYPVHSSFPSFLSPSIRLYYFIVCFSVCALPLYRAVLLELGSRFRVESFDLRANRPVRFIVHLCHVLILMFAWYGFWFHPHCLPPVPSLPFCTVGHRYFRYSNGQFLVVPGMAHCHWG